MKSPMMPGQGNKGCGLEFRRGLTLLSRHNVAYRVMSIFFMDRKGMLLVHEVPQGRTVNADYYSKVKYEVILNLKNI